MTAYIASSDASKKRRQIRQREKELAHAIRHRFRDRDLEKAVEKLRLAHLGLLKWSLPTHPTADGGRLRNLEAELEFWSTASNPEIVEHFLKHADPTLLVQNIIVAACRTPEFRETPGLAVDWLEATTRQAVDRGARLILFPECFLQGYLTEESAARRAALDLASPEFAAILHRLTALPPVLVFGLIEIEDGALYNTAVVIQKGRLLGRYRKTHIHDGESVFTPGTDYPVFEVDGLKFGINICYDTRFPEAAVAPAAQGAELLLCPSNNMLPRARAEEWKSRHHQIRSERARETGMYLLSADVAGSREDGVCYGPVSLISPHGEELTYMPFQTTGPMFVTLKLTPPHLSRGGRPVSPH